MACRTLIAIDPGNLAGVAVFENSVLVRVDFVQFARQRQWAWDGPIGAEVVCEVPQDYGPKVLKSIKGLRRTAEYLIREMHASKVHRVFPRDWKGQRPKTVDNPHTLRILNDQEGHLARGADDNMLDAIGIGLWKLGRKYQ